MANDKELRLLEALSEQECSSQRQMARRTGLSLGLVNLILRRLAKTGYIKIAALDGRTVRYVLTPKGTAELARRSYDYLRHVVATFGDLRRGIGDLADSLQNDGKRLFVIYGRGDVADIAELAFRDRGVDGTRVMRQEDGDVHADADTVVLDCRVDVPHGGAVGIHVLGHLARSGLLGGGSAPGASGSGK